MVEFYVELEEFRVAFEIFVNDPFKFIIVEFNVYKAYYKAYTSEVNHYKSYYMYLKELDAL